MQTPSLICCDHANKFGRSLKQSNVLSSLHSLYESNSRLESQHRSDFERPRLDSLAILQRLQEVQNIHSISVEREQSRNLVIVAQLNKLGLKSSNLKEIRTCLAIEYHILQF